MEDLHIEATESTPKIEYNRDEAKIAFHGRSIPENATNFYGPVFEWIKTYKSSAGEKTELEFYLDYINSISQKIILDILKEFSELNDSGSNVCVKWMFEEEDEEMEDEGKIFASKVDLDFELIALRD